MAEAPSLGPLFSRPPVPQQIVSNPGLSRTGRARAGRLRAVQREDRRLQDQVSCHRAADLAESSYFRSVKSTFGLGMAAGVASAGGWGRPGRASGMSRKYNAVAQLSASKLLRGVVRHMQGVHSRGGQDGISQMGQNGHSG